MLANWVKQTTATTGTGVIALGAAETGFIALSDAFSDGDAISYAIEDGNNREIGFGKYTAAGNTLSRDTVLETLVGGVFDKAPSVAITLSGAASISVTSAAQNMVAAPIIGSKTLGARIIGSASSNYALTSILATAQDVLYLAPLSLEYLHDIDAIIGSIETVGTATLSRIGLWEMSSDGGIGRCLIDKEIDVTTTGQKTATLLETMRIRPGLYFIGQVSNGTVSIKLTAAAGATSGEIFGWNKYSTGNRYQNGNGNLPHTYGPLPDNPLMTAVTNKGYFAIGLRSA